MRLQSHNFRFRLVPMMMMMEVTAPRGWQNIPFHLALRSIPFRFVRMPQDTHRYEARYENPERESEVKYSRLKTYNEDSNTKQRR
jgi:hypothetical protein